ncbi:hypothetical protein EYE40_03790 [Glaciihabitans arcticus]|uniref:DUF4878 domain-containing protein n=1 Tax=Glaciihabitans arcticus TaxID=2668039 RepID=A0A4Q9GWI7_9MICO|nr:hypothetical protein [Glaciihabitans arcticus]TBN56590.1 hypothetical protein EYE40_03790 [Glaciihabitans arcticus]
MTTSSTTGSSPAAPAARRERPVWITSVAVALAVGGYLIAAALISNSSDPSDEVSSYLAAIADGDASTAAHIVDPGASGNDAAYLTDDVLGAATERIEVVSVITTRREGDTAEVTAVMKLASKTFNHTFTVTRDAGSYWLLRPGWHPDAPLTVSATVTALDRISLTGMKQVNFAGNQLELAVSDIPGVSADSESESVQVYPAVYDLTGPELGTYFSVESTELVALPPTATAALAVAATGELQTALLDAANVQANACVEPGTSTDAACPVFLRQQDPSTTGVIRAPYNLSFRTDHRFMVNVKFWYGPEGARSSGGGATVYTTDLIGKYTVTGDDVTVELTTWEDL